MALCTLCSSWGEKWAEKRGGMYYIKREAWVEKREKWDGDRKSRYYIAEN